MKTESFIKAPDAFAVQTVEERNLLVDLGGFVENSPRGEWIYFANPEYWKKSQNTFPQLLCYFDFSAQGNQADNSWPIKTR